MAVVRRTNRLTMLLSRVLKYCPGKEAEEHVGTSRRAHSSQELAATGHVEHSVLPSLHPTNSASSQAVPEGWQRDEQTWSADPSTFLNSVLLAEADN